MNIDTMAKNAYSNAVRLGKIGNRSPIEKLKDLQSEYMEAFKALNGDDHARMDLFEGMISVGGDFKESFISCVKDTYEDELIDCLKVILTLMEDCGMDKEKHWECKTIYNELREDHK